MKMLLEDVKATDYVDIYLEALYIGESRLLKEEFLYFIQEAEGVKTSSMVLLEASGQTFLQRVKSFFNNIWTAFTDKVKLLTQSNDKWLRENRDRIMTGVDYGNLEITIYPYWNYPVNNIDSIIQSTIKITADNIKKLESANARGEDLKEVINNIHKAGAKALGASNDDDPVKDILYRLFRTGNPAGPLESVRLTGKELAEKVAREFYPYCMSYNTTVNKLKDAKAKLEAEMERVDKALSQKTQATTTTAESFMTVTEAAVHLLFEADANGPKEGDKPAEQTTTKATEDKKPDNGVVKKKEDMSGDKELNGKKVDYRDLTSAQLEIRKSVFQGAQITFTSMLTAFEERYLKYVSVLKAMVSKGKIDNTKNVEVEQKSSPKKK